MTKLTFFGATKGVTGSAYLVETGLAKMLLECGLVQGGREEKKANEKPFPFSIGQLDAVILSHARLDHSGRLPRLVADGYGGAGYMTHPTCDLLEITHQRCRKTASSITSSALRKYVYSICLHIHYLDQSRLTC